MIYPPSPKVACKEKSEEVISGLREVSRFVFGSGRPGYAEKIDAAEDRIRSLMESYLAACDENDRMRKRP